MLTTFRIFCLFNFELLKFFLHYNVQYGDNDRKPAELEKNCNFKTEYIFTNFVILTFRLLVYIKTYS
jgi:hypothetical protein